MFLVYDLNANPLNSNDWAFPLCECFHITSFALSIGTIALVDLKMLGLASGLAIFSSDPVMYYHNKSFRVKVLLLLVAILYNYTVHRRAANSGASSAAVAVISLMLWLSIVFAGIFIAFV